MKYTKITGAYWKNKKRYYFYIDTEKERAEYLFKELLKSLSYEKNEIFEIAKQENYEKE